MNSAIWALVSQLLALLAIPHAAALALSKLVSTSTRPGPTTASKTMDAAAYATLAVISAIVVNAYGAAAQQEAASAVAQSSTTGGGITLQEALWMYGSVYGFALVGLGAVVYSLKTVLHNDGRDKVRGALLLLGFFALVCWFGVLHRVQNFIGFASLSDTSKAAIIFGPPLAVVLAVYCARVRDRRQTRETTGTDRGDH